MLKIVPLPLLFSFGATATTIYPSLIFSGDEVILVDAGYPGLADALLAAAAQQGVDLHALTSIVLTHHDYDHTGSLAAVKRMAPQALVLAPVKEAPFIRGETKAFRLQQAEAIYPTLPEEAKEGARQFEAFLKSIEPCTVDRTVGDGDVLDKAGQVKVVATPGHTEGHISLFMAKANTLIAGDALVYENGTLALANPQYAYDRAGANASAEKIVALGAETIICYHGGTAPSSATYKPES